jgi:GT2 family glycosyltransferase
MVLRREAIEDVGLLDEDYFMYTEEVDLCHRIRKAGWGVYWVPEAEVLHYGGQSTKQRKLEMFLQLYASKIQFFRKRHGPASTAAYKILIAFASLPRLILLPISWFASFLNLDIDRQVSKHYLRLLLSLPSM